MPELIPVLSKEEIAQKVEALARRISADYQGHDLVLIGILKGSFIFLSDLARYLTIPVRIEFMRAASYGSRTASSGNVQISMDMIPDIDGMDVLLVEDIVDSGQTLSCLVDCLESSGAKSVRICAMIDKKERRETDIVPHYAGHTVETGFLVGYGLDYAEKYRELPAIYHLEF